MGRKHHVAASGTPEDVSAPAHSAGQTAELSHGVVPLGALAERHKRGAYFTPGLIADYLAKWAIRDNAHATVLDPTCGGGIFLEAAGRHLLQVGATREALAAQVHGIDIHGDTIRSTRAHLEALDLDASFTEADFFKVPAPDVPNSAFQKFDAVLGNPPFVRFHHHRGDDRDRSTAAALAQGVRLPQNASSWAASLVHAAAFVKPTGTLAWVVPAELLTVSYAEPVRRWLQRRFSWVRLVFIEKPQFADAQERVLLLIASGSGGCESFTLMYVQDSDELETFHPLDVGTGVPAAEGKWTDMLLTMREKVLLRTASQSRFVPLAEYGKVVLGTVTGANKYFCMSDEDRSNHGLEEQVDVIATLPSPARTLSTSLAFTTEDWSALKRAGEPVWMLNPALDADRPEVAAYLARGERDKVHEGYKCRHRKDWWRIPVVAAPDLFFTYMSHRMPRLVANEAHTTFLNSLHGIRLNKDAPKGRAAMLAMTSLNSLTLLFAELNGRSYGGGVLKLEPTETANLRVPGPELLQATWASLGRKRGHVRTLVGEGLLDEARSLVDAAMLQQVLELDEQDTVALQAAASRLRSQRLGTTTKESGSR